MLPWSGSVIIKWFFTYKGGSIKPAFCTIKGIFSILQICTSERLCFQMNDLGHMSPNFCYFKTKKLTPKGGYCCLHQRGSKNHRSTCRLTAASCSALPIRSEESTPYWATHIQCFQDTPFSPDPPVPGLTMLISVFLSAVQCLFRTFNTQITIIFLSRSNDHPSLSTQHCLQKIRKQLNYKFHWMYNHQFT